MIIIKFFSLCNCFWNNNKTMFCLTKSTTTLNLNINHVASFFMKKNRHPLKDSLKHYAKLNNNILAGICKFYNLWM